MKISRRKALSLLALTLASACGPRSNALAIYCAQDQVYAEPIFSEFTSQTGLSVRALFDSEATKAVGLTNRLIAEKNHPQAAVFWNNEALRSHQLAKAGVIEPVIREFGHRSRRMVINTRLLSASDAPRDWLELADPKWRGKFAMAYPLFGATATHFVALREKLGPSEWITWCKKLAENKPFLVDGNSIVTQLVGSGDAVVGMTDCDDIVAGIRNGLPLAALPLSENSLLIPNTLCTVKDGPEPGLAAQFAEFITSPETRAKLVALGALEGAESSASGGFAPDWAALVDQLTPAVESLRDIFLRA